MKTRENNYKKDVFYLLSALAAGKVLLLLAVFLYKPSSNFLYLMSTAWDAGHFQDIAAQGYFIDKLYAFSPVFPGLIKGLNFIIPSTWISALIITNAVSFLFPLVLYKTFNFRTALLAELFPAYLVFTTLPYSDVISLFFLAAALFLLLKDKVIKASGAVALAILNSFSLAWTLPSYLFALLNKKKISNLWFYVFPAAAGVLILLWFKWQTGDFLTYFKIEGTEWNVRFTDPVTQASWLLTTGKEMFANPVYYISGLHLTAGYALVRNLLFEAFYIFGIIRLFMMKQQNSFFLGVFSIFAGLPLLFLIGTPVVSIPRLLLPAFPVFVAYAAIMQKTRSYIIYSAVSMILAALIAILQTYSFFA